MLKNPLYKYGDEKFKVSAHLHYGKEIFDKMLENKHITALINAETNESITYNELAQKTADIALSLTSLGVRKGDVISICSEKRVEILPTILGIICAGATFSPMDYTQGAHLLHFLKIGKPKIMFCSPAAYKVHKSSFDEVGTIENYIMYGNEKRDSVLSFEEFLTETAVNLKDFQPVPVDGYTDLTFIMYSSGTTGLSKGVPLTHMNSLSNTQSVVSDKFRQARVLNIKEWNYTYTLILTLSCLRAGCTIVYLSTQKEEVVLEAIQKYKTSLLALVPSELVKYINSTILKNYDVSSVEWIMTTSTPATADVIDAVKTRFPNLKNVLQKYGMSETGCISNEAHAPLGPRSGSSGVACPGFVIKVVDLATRQPLGPNQRGEILLKGPATIKGYCYNMLPDCKDSEGFFKTGDIGYYDEDGYFYIVNRIKELIKFNGFCIPPAEFETILQQHPAVREAGVVGLPHKECGEAPVAFIALQPGTTATEHELVEYLHSKVTFRMRLAGGVRFVEQLPRGANDKLNRQALKQMLGVTP